MADGVAFIDGEYSPAHEARIPPFDLGFTRGDAVYDTVSVWKGRFFRLDDHIARFLRSCAGAAEPALIRRRRLKRDPGGMRPPRRARRTPTSRLIVTRGVFVSMTKRDPRLCRNRFVAFALPVHLDRAARAPGGRHRPRPWSTTCRTPTEAIDPRVKNFNWMDLQRGLFEALDRGADTAVLCTPPGTSPRARASTCSS